MTDWKQSHANASKHAIEHPLVQEAMRMSHEEVGEVQRMLIEMAYRAKEPVFVVAPDGVADDAGV